MSKVDPQSSSSGPSTSPSGDEAAASATAHVDKIKALLEKCKIERKEARNDVELYRNRCIANKTELYQLLAFYSVFQGVVFNTVATSAKLTCQTSMLPVFLTFLASVAAATSVHFKLTDYGVDKQKLLLGENISAHVKRKMSLLEDHRDTHYRRDEDALKKNLRWDEDTLKKNLRRDEQSRTKYYRIVMSFLLVFSLTIQACCILLRCWDTDKQTIMVCFFTVCFEKYNVTVSIHKF